MEMGSMRGSERIDNLGKSYSSRANLPGFMENINTVSGRNTSKIMAGNDDSMLYQNLESETFIDPSAPEVKQKCKRRH